MSRTPTRFYKFPPLPAALDIELQKAAHAVDLPISKAITRLLTAADSLSECISSGLGVIVADEPLPEREASEVPEVGVHYTKPVHLPAQLHGAIKAEAQRCGVHLGAVLRHVLIAYQGQVLALLRHDLEQRIDAAAAA